jgi:hypothetical protein
MTRDQLVEAGSAVLLAFATVVTAWATYQATLFGGDESRGYFMASATQLRAAEMRAFAREQRGVHAALFVEYASALATGQHELSAFLFERFPEPLRGSTSAWLATRPLVNPAAPKTPFELPEYALSAESDAADLVRQATALFETAQTADAISDGYVRLTVFFALVLFLSGVAGKFRWVAIDIAMLALAIATLIWATIQLASMPFQ